jgi:DnaJ-class molecular chaperone
MALDRCPACVGKKKIMGLGSMIKDCPECHGVGYVKVPEVVVEPVKRKYTKKTED